MESLVEGEGALLKGVEALTADDNTLRGAFALEGDARAETKADLMARAKATRSGVRIAEKRARLMDAIASLL